MFARLKNSFAALVVTSTAFHGIVPTFSTESNQVLVNSISTTLAFTSLGTTATATCLIGYRIYHTSHNHIMQSKRTFTRIAVAIVESSAVYSLVLFLYALTLVIPILYSLQSPLWQFAYYVEAFAVVVSVSVVYEQSSIWDTHTWRQGMAPTVMVARLALTSTNNEASSGTVTHVSGLKFNPPQRSEGSGSDSHATGDGDGADHSVHGEEVDQEKTPVFILKSKSSPPETTYSPV